ncbi:hypothetical protein BTO30_13575 [Domibacillus antri]|uniref:EAL domain-containing protein n=2 Tax=Domibacillus antri TaxID=1714264 RepID=A0A1Q8Q2X1_9BACI|nr:hypothetical protein BTO30_13575 [Domibacillus antri]
MMALRDGKNKNKPIHLFQQHIQEAMTRQLTLEKDLQNVSIGDEFSIVFQPQVKVSTNEIIGFESLARWRHPLFGPISPVEFIALAEEKLIIYQLTERTIDYVFKILETRKREYSFTGIVSINISSLLLEHVVFIEFVRSRLSYFDINPKQIEFEITESVQLFSSETVLSHLQLLRKMGIRISIDDFGTGYAALSYLSHFPVDKVKIDKHFIDQIDTDRKGEAILKSIISLIKNMELYMIAEGVETADQIRFLKERGCDHIQGYYVSKPLTEEKSDMVVKNGCYIK